MSKFYLLLWTRWVLRVTLCSLFLATTMAFITTITLYINKGSPEVTQSVLEALYDINNFLFPIIWSFTILIALFRSLKYIFNSPLNSYKLELLTCKRDEIIEFVGYGDLVKIWRKWFMLMIWFVAIEMTLTTAFVYIFNSEINLFSWFNIYFLFIFILISGYLSILLLVNRCKRIRIVKC